jgi:integrase
VNLLSQVYNLPTVRQTLEQIHGCIRFKKPKTRKSQRIITLLSLTVEALRAHEIEQKKLRLIVGPAYEDSGLVFAREDGSVWPPDGLTSSYRKLIRKVGLGAVRFHDLRHSHATQLLHQGIHPKVVSERLGHSIIAITLDTYSHVLPGIQEEAASKLDAALRSAFGKTS